ncbi:MAG TPA: hypothetical protein VL866_24565 [Pyrinomonadaceae bacterium]|nr:hypothetical protein [Pyrinomonadaceae bacterium]
MAATLIGIIGAINTLTPLATQLINQLRQTGETDEQVIARARALAAETKKIAEEDMGNQA